jgi:hypothetical protein
MAGSATWCDLGVGPNQVVDIIHPMHSMPKAELNPSALKYAVIFNGYNLKKTLMGGNGVPGVGGSNPLVPTIFN